MKYFSTRSGFEATASEAIARGLAPNGGLYVPNTLPGLTEDKLIALEQMDYRGRASEIMGMFLPEFTAEELERFAVSA